MFEHLRNTKPYHSTVVLVGDPARAEFIAKHYLKQTECLTTHRGLLGFNGTYHHQPLSIQTTGMGSASAAIVMEELIQAGVATFYRLGSCCLLSSTTSPLDDESIPMMVPTQASSRARIHDNYHHWLQTWLQPNYQPNHLVVSKLLLAARRKKLRVKAVAIASVDAYYNHQLDTEIQRLLRRGVQAIDMETSTIFDIAAHYQKSAVALLNPYDVLEYNQVQHSSSHRVLPTTPYRQRTKLMIELALNQIAGQ